MSQYSEISVLMSVYNGEDYIADSIESILNQTYTNFELLIVNDGSNDHTIDIIKSYKDDRIRLFNLRENHGVGAALQFGLTKIKGKYFAKADADDLNHPDRLMKQKTFLDAHPEIFLVKSLIEYFPHNKQIGENQKYLYKKAVLEKEKNSVISPEEIKEKLYWSCCVPHVTIMAHSDQIKKLGYGDLRVWEDYNLLYQLNKMGCKMATIEEVLVRVRISETSTTAVTDSKVFANVMYQIKKNEIVNLFNSLAEVIVWGSGSMGQNILEVLQENGFDIRGFVDSDPQKSGSTLKGKTIYTPDLLLNKSKNYKIIVASQPGKNEIVTCLKEMDYRHLEDFLVYY